MRTWSPVLASACMGRMLMGPSFFYCFYWVATSLRGAHMLIGIGLVGWIAWCDCRGDFLPGYAHRTSR